MVFPKLETRIEKLNDVTGCGINAGEIWTFMEITVRAGKGQVLYRVILNMLLSANVLHMERQKWNRDLPHPAVLTHTFRTLENELACRGIHHAALVAASIISRA